MPGREESAFRKDASNPESAAHNHVDPHGLLDTMTWLAIITKYNPLTG